MDPFTEQSLLVTRRHFFGRMAAGIGTAALGSLLNPGLFAALDDFWSGDVPGLSGADELAPEGTIVQFGQPPTDWISSTRSKPSRSTRLGRAVSRVVLVVGDEEMPLPYIGRAELIKNKQATGRPKDLDDLSYLTSVR